jgi:hypothetical protein
MWIPEVWTVSSVADLCLGGMLVLTSVFCWGALFVLRSSLMRQGRDQDFAIGMLACCVISGATFFLVMGIPDRFAAEKRQRDKDAEWQAIVDREEPFIVMRSSSSDKDFSLVQHEKSKVGYFMRYEGLSKLERGQRFVLRQDGTERRVISLPDLAPPPRLKLVPTETDSE